MTDAAVVFGLKDGVREVSYTLRDGTTGVVKRGDTLKVTDPDDIALLRDASGLKVADKSSSSSKKETK